MMVGKLPKLYESRYYIPAGKKLEDVKDKDRYFTLHISKEGWDHLTQHMPKKPKGENLIKERFKRVQEESEAMKKQWYNSEENKRWRKVQEGFDRKGRKEQELIDRYYAVAAEAEERRQELLKKKRYKIIASKPEHKSLDTAFRLSHTIAERDKHVELKQRMAKAEKEADDVWAIRIRQGAEDEKREKLEELQKIKSKKRELGKYLITQKLEIQKRLKDEALKNLEADIRAREQASKEVERLKQLEIDGRKERRELNRIERRKYLEEQYRLEKDLMAEEKELNQIVQLIQKTKADICRKIKEQRSEALKKLCAKMSAAGADLVKIQKVNDAIWEKITNKAIAEKQALAEARILDELEHKKKFREERIEDMKKSLEMPKKQKEDAEEVGRWLMANRFKQTEVMNGYEGQLKDAARKKRLEYGKELEKQMKAKQCAKIIEEIREKRWADSRFANQDKEFFEYAETIMNATKNNGWSTYPIEKCILNYKRNNNLYKPPTILDNCSCTETKLKSGRRRHIANRRATPLPPRVCKNTRCLKHQRVLLPSADKNKNK